MGLFGGSESKSQASPQSRAAAGILLEAIVPGADPLDGGYASDTIQRIYDQGGGTGSILGTGGDTFGGLPSIGEIGDFNTVFEKYSNGQLDSASSLIMDTMLSNLQGGSGSVYGQLSGSFANAGGTSGAGVAAPDYSKINYIPPENVGTYTSEIYNSLPPNFQTFIDDVMSNGTQQAIDAELDNLASALMNEAQLDANSLGNQLLGAFAANGLGASGSAVDAMKGLAAEVTIRVNSQVAQARLQALQILQNNRAIANQTLDTLIQAGTAERAQDVQGQIAEMDAIARIMSAQLTAQANIQSSLYAAQANLGAAQLGFIESAFQTLTAQSTREEEFRQQAQLLPYQILTDLSKGISNPTTTSKTDSSILGDAIGAVAGIGTAGLLSDNGFFGFGGSKEDGK